MKSEWSKASDRYYAWQRTKERLVLAWVFLALVLGLVVGNLMIGVMFIVFPYIIYKIISGVARSIDGYYDGDQDGN